MNMELDLEKNPPKSNSNFNLYLASCAIATLGISFGCSLSWTSPTLPKLTVPNDRIDITKEEAAWLGSFFSLGGILGPILNISLADRIGRKYTLIVYGAAMTLSWSIMVVFNSIKIMCVARFLNGLTAGPSSILIPMYIVEISTAETRGTTGTFYSIFVNAGCCIPYFVGPFTSYVTLTSICACASFIGLVICLWAPESPCYLVAKGYRLEAYDTVKWLLDSPDQTKIQNEIAKVEEIYVKSPEGDDVSGRKCLLNRTNIKCFYYCCTIVFFQQVCGITAVVYYSQSIFRQTGSSFSAVASSMICGAVLSLGAFLPAYISKMLSVKNMLQISTVGCSLFLAMLSSYFYLQEYSPLIPFSDLVPVISIIGFIIAFTLGLGPFTGVVMIEILPIDLKVKGTALISMYSWFLSFMFTRFFFTMIETTGPACTFGCFTFICGVASLFVSVQLPETQGLTFLEIQELIQGRNFDKLNSNSKEKKTHFANI